MIPWPALKQTRNVNRSWISGWIVVTRHATALVTATAAATEMANDLIWHLYGLEMQLGYILEEQQELLKIQLFSRVARDLFAIQDKLLKCVCACVCVCVWERETDRQTYRQK